MPSAEPAMAGWRRRGGALAIALLLWTGLLMAFAGWLGEPPLPALPLAVEVAEVPPPRPKTSRVAPPPRPPARRLLARPLSQTPRSQVAPPKQRDPDQPAPAAQAAPSAQTPVAPPAREAEASAPAVTEAGATDAISGGNLGARAVYSPLPELPPELREDAFQAEVVVCFSIQTDGSAKVRMVQGTLNPRLNGLLLEALSTWRFFPALRESVPVASELELRIPIAIE